MSATIVKVDKGKDLALLRGRPRSSPGWPPAGATVKPGQQIVVVGAPLGLEDTVTTGVVSAFRRTTTDGPTIQFDAPINPGNSGGPVVNAAKQVVGLATAKARDAEGIGLAVPIKTACDDLQVCLARRRPRCAVARSAVTPGRRQAGGRGEHRAPAVAGARPGRRDVGVQEARISRSAVGAGPASSPNRVDVVWVIVPPIAVYAARVLIQASVSQVQATAGQQRVAGHVRLQLGGHQRDQAQVALPGVVPGRVVQQDQPAAGHLVAVAQHGGAERETVRGEPLRRGDLLEQDLLARRRRPQPGDGAGERLGCAVGGAMSAAYADSTAVPCADRTRRCRRRSPPPAIRPTLVAA